MMVWRARMITLTTMISGQSIHTTIATTSTIKMDHAVTTVMIAISKTFVIASVKEFWANFWIAASLRSSQ
jgi:hypothetical protein